jgi:hypothetical protein
MWADRTGKTNHEIKRHNCGQPRNSLLNLDYLGWAHECPQIREPGAKPQCTRHAADSRDQYRSGCSNPAAETACDEAAERRHPDKGHRVIAHDSAAAFVRNDCLQDCVAGSEVHHHSETDNQEKEKRKPEPVGKGESDQASAEEPARDGDQLSESFVERISPSPSLQTRSAFLQQSN